MTMLNGVSQDERQAWERFIKVYRDLMCESVSRTGKAGRRSHRGTCGFVCCWCVASCATRGRDAPAPCGDRFMGPRAETDSWGGAVSAAQISDTQPLVLKHSEETSRGVVARLDWIAEAGAAAYLIYYPADENKRFFAGSSVSLECDGRVCRGAGVCGGQ